MPLSTKATRQLTKQHNRDLVLHKIFENQTISRAEIARLTKLTRTTVSDVVAGLLKEGLVEEVGLSSSIGGKPSILLSLVTDSRYLIGLNLMQDKFIGAVLNLWGEIKETVEIPVDGRDGTQALSLLYHILDRLTQNTWTPIVGIGVGAPGLINTREGTVISAVNLDWKELPLAHLLEKRYGLPVSVLNDSQATAIGEFVHGNHPAGSNLIVLTVMHGIGAGILINGQLFQGDGGGAGEIGHAVVQENGLPCRCGRNGCLETVASAQAVVARMQSMTNSPDPISLDVLESRFQHGDQAAHQVIMEAATYLGRSIGNLIATFNIKTIVLTGDMTRFGEPWLMAAKEAMSQAALGSMVEGTQLYIGKLDYRACILGSAAYLLLDGYSLLFTHPGN